MALSIFLTTALVAASNAFLFPRQTIISGPGRYSDCTSDRGYNATDADAAAFWLVNNVTSTNGRWMTKGECIYGHVNSTIVSICNGDYGNRTLTQDDARRGIMQLQKDCGADGSFSGIHVVNNLTFGAYGVYGGKGLAVPAGWDDPTTSGTRRRHLNAHEFLSYNCGEPQGHVLNADGSCGTLTVANQCQEYCEIRRTYFIGPETLGVGNWGNAFTSGVTMTITSGTEITVGGGFSIGAEGTFQEVISAGVDFEYNVEVTTTTESSLTSPVCPDKVSCRWVYFAQYVETCGSVSAQDYNPGSICGPACGGGAPEAPSCSGSVVTTGNVCSLTPYTLGGQPQLMYTVRYEDAQGNVLPLAQQADGYRFLCDTQAGPGGAWECAAPKGSKE